MHIVYMYSTFLPRSAQEIWAFQGSLWVNWTQPCARKMRFSKSTNFAILLIVASISNVQCGRVKRSLVDFGQIIHLLTGKSALDFNGYGNWCGMGGSGPVVDEVDRCCKTHDKCYEALKDVCGNPKGSYTERIYSEQYEWTSSNGRMKCKSNPGCKRSLCECDVTAARCFARNLAVYDKKNVSFLGNIIDHLKKYISF